MVKTSTRRQRFFGLGCMGVLLLCGGSVFLALFVGGLLFNQSQAGKAATSLPAVGSALPSQPVVSTAAARPSASTVSSDILVTIEPSATTPPTDTTTATPAPALLGTNAFLLTATSEQGAAMTRAAAYRDGIYATRTAAAQAEAEIFAALTATARSRQERR